ncbi:MAG: MobA protein [Odoribacter sp.]|nr:MobA protein [Odoribacter sp.]
MQHQNKTLKRKPGRKTIVDKTEKRLTIRLNDEEYNRLLNRFEKSGLKTKTDFVKHLLFDKEIIVKMKDENTSLFYEKLVHFYNQYRAIGNNYNQVSKQLKVNFSEQRAFQLITLQVGYVKKLLQITEEVGVLINDFKRWLQK